jgi:hypothetical protein
LDIKQQWYENEYPIGLLAEWKSFKTRSTSPFTVISAPAVAKVDLDRRFYLPARNHRRCNLQVLGSAKSTWENDGIKIR